MPIKKYILALDEGTSSCKAILYDCSTNTIVNAVKAPVSCYYPQNGWVEQDAERLWQTSYECLREIIANTRIKVHNIAAFGLTNQRESVVVWDKETGLAIAPCINWQCRRTMDKCNELRPKYGRLIKQKTGLVLDAYFSATKIAWILDNVEGARERAMRGELLCGTIDSWIIYKLTGGKQHITDLTNASRTMLYNIITNKWDKKLCQILGVPMNMLPTVVDNCGHFGEFNYFGHSVPITGIIGDQQSSLFGQCCVKPMQVKCTYGTGCFVLANIGTIPKICTTPMLTTIAYKIDNNTVYAIEGSVFNGGSAIQWLKDDMKLIERSKDSDRIASSISDNGGVYVVPAFTGLGAPHWDMNARGLIVGISRSTNSAHIIRATIEGIAHSCQDVFDVISEELGESIALIKIDGGASRNDFLVQMQANLAQTPIVRSNNTETTLLGAVYMAGLGVGIYRSIKELQKIESLAHQFDPVMTGAAVKIERNNWRKAVKRSLKWKD